jgi:hypothetical protein
MTDKLVDAWTDVLMEGYDDTDDCRDFAADSVRMILATGEAQAIKETLRFLDMNGGPNYLVYILDGCEGGCDPEVLKNVIEWVRS